MHTWGRIFKVQQQCLLCRSLASSNKSWSTVASVASQLCSWWRPGAAGTNITHFSTIIELVKSSFHSSLHPTWRESFWSCSSFRQSSWHQIRLLCWLNKNFMGAVKVRDVLMNCQLAPVGRQPVIAIDQCQVRLLNHFEGGFRLIFRALPCHKSQQHERHWYQILGFRWSFWLVGVPLQLWQLHLDLVDRSLRSKVGTCSILSNSV